MNKISLKEVMYRIDEFCFYNKHQYHDAQGGICKLCDRCPLGWGLSDFKDRRFDIDPQHGALGCQHCLRCRKGFFSSHFSYEQCKPCLDCRKDGKYEIHPCSSAENAVCGSLLPNKFESGYHPYHHYSDNSNIILATVIPSVVILAVVIAAFIYLHLKRRRSRISDVERQSNKGDTTTTLLSTSSLSTFTNSQSDIETDSVDDMISAIEQWKLIDDRNKEMSYKQARMICKYMTTKKIFHDIGLQLGVQEIDIQIIMTDNDGVEEQAYGILKKWMQLKASDATVFNFLDVLLNLELYDIAKLFCDKYDIGSDL